MVRRSARLAVKSGAHLPNKGTLGSLSTESLAGKTPAPHLKRKRLGATRKARKLKNKSDKDYIPFSAGAWNHSPFVRVFPLGKGFVGKIIPVALILLLSLGVWFLFPALPIQSLFAAAFTAVDGSESTVTNPFALRSCSVLEQQPLIKAEITRLQQQLSRLRPYLFIVRWASLGILQKAKSETHPGQCWPFRGSEGFAVIALSHPVEVTHVSLEHLPRGSSPTGGITSAPKDFALYGLLREDQREGHHLGNFTFNQDGESVQTFKLPGSHEDVYHLVELRILSNWGHPEYTCVYSFRVHGRPQTN